MVVGRRINSLDVEVQKSITNFEIEVQKFRILLNLKSKFFRRRSLIFVGCEHSCGVDTSDFDHGVLVSCFGIGA